MKNRVEKLLNSDGFVIFIGLVIVPIASFMLITLGDESPLYTSISRLAWVNGYWLSTFVWALIVMSSVGWITYRTVFTGPLSESRKVTFTACQLVNIILVFLGCIVFPAKSGENALRLAHYVHDYLTIAAWAMYGIGLLVYSLMLRKHDRFLSLLGISLMCFIIFCKKYFQNIN